MPLLLPDAGDTVHTDVAELMTVHDIFDVTFIYLVPPAASMLILVVSIDNVSEEPAAACLTVTVLSGSVDTLVALKVILV